MRKQEVRPQKRGRKFSSEAAAPPRPLPIWQLQKEANGETPRPRPWILQLGVPVLKAL